MWLQLVATSLFTSHREKATSNCSPVAISCGPVQLPVRVKSCNWTLKHYLPVPPLGRISVKSSLLSGLKKSYLVISVLPESSAYGPFIPLLCQVYLPTSFLVLPPLRRLQYSMFASHLSNAILERYCALNSTMEHS